MECFYDINNTDHINSLVAQYKNLKSAQRHKNVHSLLYISQNVNQAHSGESLVYLKAIQYFIVYI
jgi:hypothetical protein